MLNDEGETFVLAAGKEFKVIARNKLDERILASPAISNCVTVAVQTSGLAHEPRPSTSLSR